MASEKKLDSVILGLLSHEDLTGYEIKRRMDTTLKYFWGASFGSIYPTLNQLADSGCITGRGETCSGRKRVVYTITDKGRDQLREWLAQPAQRDEIRYETLLKLFFAAENTPQQAVEHIEAFERRISAELPRLEQAHAALSGSLTEEKAHLYYMLTVEFGLKTYNAYLDWCKEAKALLKGE